MLWSHGPQILQLAASRKVLGSVWLRYSASHGLFSPNIPPTLMGGCGLFCSPAIYDAAAAAVRKFSQHRRKFSLFHRGSGRRLGFCRCTGTPPPPSCVGPQVAFHILQTAPQRRNVYYDAKLPQQEAITTLCYSTPSAAWCR